MLHVNVAQGEVWIAALPWQRLPDDGAAECC